MKLVCLHAKAEIEAFARQNPLFHLFEIGDLDDFFWPHTVWYALKEGETVRQLALLYTAQSPPVLLANAEQPLDSMRELLRALVPLLPKRMYTHLDPQVADTLANDYWVEPRGIHHKMGLRDPSRLAAFDTPAAVALSEADLGDLEALYRASYPGNSFAPRLLETGFYYGIRQGSRLISMAGVHVYSQRYKVAALGNVTTHPDMRRRGLATAVCAKLCRALLRSGVETIGLNVKADNASAIACYEKLGFERVAEFGAYMLKLKHET